MKRAKVHPECCSGKWERHPTLHERRLPMFANDGAPLVRQDDGQFCLSWLCADLLLG